MVTARFEDLTQATPFIPEMRRPIEDDHNSMAHLGQLALAESFRGLGEERREFIATFGRLLHDATLEQSHEPGGRFRLEVFRGEMLCKNEEKLRHPEWGRLWQSVITAYDAKGNRVGREGLVDGKLHHVDIQDIYQANYANSSMPSRLPKALFRYSIDVGPVDATRNSFTEAEAALVEEKAGYAALERDLRNIGLNETLAHWLTRRRAVELQAPEPGRFAGLRRRLGLAAAEGSDALVQP